MVSYVNGLHFAIEDEFGMIKLRSVEEAYECALKVKEKLATKQRGNFRVRGRSSKGRV